MNRFIAALLCASILLISGPVYAAAHPGFVKLQMNAAKSGRTIRYTIVATNMGVGPALDLEPIGKIPADTKYVLGTARAANASLEYTLDGKNWSANPKMATHQSNGKIVMKSADPSAYTGLRWHMNTALAAHKAASFMYEVIVK